MAMNMDLYKQRLWETAATCICPSAAVFFFLVVLEQEGFMQLFVRRLAL